MWTASARAWYRRAGGRYASDVSLEDLSGEQEQTEDRH
jgi:hypothetical protein